MICYPIKTSNVQSKVRHFLNDKSLNFIENDRTVLSPKELDFYLHEYKIAIEVNGVMDHSLGESNSSRFNNLETHENISYHVNKSLGCLKQNIKLFHFTDIEIRNKFNIYMSYILKNINKVKEFKDNLIMRNISDKCLHEFIINNSLIEAITSFDNFGIYKDDILVGVFSYTETNNKIVLHNLCEHIDFKIFNFKESIILFFKKRKPVQVFMNCDYEDLPNIKFIEAEISGLYRLVKDNNKFRKYYSSGYFQATY